MRMAQRSNKTAHTIKLASQSSWLFVVFAALSIVCAAISAALETIIPLAIPISFLVAYLCVVDYAMVFYLLLACLPLSMEYEFPNGLSTDLPTEPLMFGLMLIYLVVRANQKPKTDVLFWRHPITLLILLAFFWECITAMHAEILIRAVKQCAAKFWYICTFYFLASHILRSEKAMRAAFWCLFSTLLFGVTVTLFRHGLKGFAFREVNYVMQPFFRNHVMYASIIVVIFPLVWLALDWYEKNSATRIFLYLGGFILLLGVQFAYTRGAYVALVGALGFYFIVKYRITAWFLGLSLLVAVIFFKGLIEDNHFMAYAPRYERAITHYKFENLVEATAKGEDVSTMERVYRWVAGVQMIAEKPFLGFGAGNFYTSYRPYTVTRFKTYVSANEEQSTVHCYFLLLGIEQGIPGALIFIALLFVAFLRGQNVYHSTDDKMIKRIVMAMLLILFIILQLILINDLIETDKIGGMFYLTLAVITVLDVRYFKTNENEPANNIVIHSEIVDEDLMPNSKKRI